MARTQQSIDRKRQRKEEKLLDDGSWKVFKVCALCQVPFCVNLPGARAEFNEPIMGLEVCIWCRTRRGKALVRHLKLVQRLAQQECVTPRAEDCGRCLPCIARKTLASDEKELLADGHPAEEIHDGVCGADVRL